MENEKFIELEKELENLKNIVSLIDTYSRQTMSDTLSIIGLIIAISGLVIIGASYYMIRSIINNKVEREIEKKFLNVLKEKSPIFNKTGKYMPDDNKRIFLPNDLEGIEDLEPKTLIFIQAEPNETVLDQLNYGLKPKLWINEEGTRVIEFEHYYRENGEITISLAWVRKNY